LLQCLLTKSPCSIKVARPVSISLRSTSIFKDRQWPSRYDLRTLLLYSVASVAQYTSPHLACAFDIFPGPAIPLQLDDGDVNTAQDATSTSMGSIIRIQFAVLCSARPPKDTVCAILHVRRGHPDGCLVLHPSMRFHGSLYSSYLPLYIRR